MIKLSSEYNLYFALSYNRHINTYELLYHDLSIQIKIHIPQTLLADVGFYGITIKIWLI